MLAVLPLLVCAMALLPPPGFALCVDADGHLVIEAEAPGAARCCVGPGAGAGEACAPASCAQCVDIAIASSEASAVKELRGGVPMMAMHASPPLRGADLGVTNSRGVPAAPAPAAAPPMRTVFLRV
jgi:hypothetical protein